VNLTHQTRPLVKKGRLGLVSSNASQGTPAASDSVPLFSLGHRQAENTCSHLRGLHKPGVCFIY
jgi:hypothetical protein